MRGAGSIALAAVAFALGATEAASATTFQFSPVRVNLTTHDHVSSVTLTNIDDTALRLEVQAYRWTQLSNGEPSLDPSSDLLVFPALLTIPAHGQRRLRVAATDPSGSRELAYKIAITEIGSFSTPRTRRADVLIAMQANIPVFVAPSLDRRVAAIASASVQKRALAFAVVNAGSVHFVTTNVSVTGLGADTRPLFTSALDGGDVLAEGERRYRMDLPRKTCGSLRALTIRLAADEQQLTQTLDVPAGACNP